MHKLDKQQILDGCLRDRAFYRGINYYEEGAVREVNYHPSLSTIHSVVRGNKDYLVKLKHNQQGKFDEVYCSCPDFNNYPGYFCKHIVAVLFNIKNKSFDPAFGEDKKLTEKILEELAGQGEEKLKENINLEIIYHFDDDRYDRSSYLELKVGIDKIYVVKNIRNFLNATYRGEELVFGKKFTFDPMYHTFLPKDKELMDLLWEIYEIDRYKGVGNYSNANTSLFSGKEVYLPDALVKRLFTILLGRKFKVSINGKEPIDSRIIQEDLPLSFNLDREGENIIIKEKISPEIKSLTTCGSYFYYQGMIYKPSLRQLSNFNPFFLTMEKQKKEYLTLLPQYKEKFISEVIPKLKKAGRIEIHENLLEEIDEIPLKTKLFLDMEQGNLIGELLFNYGERQINPFRPNETTLNDRILLRDVEKERAIMIVLEKAQFKVKNGKIHLNDEDTIYEFIYNILPQIEDIEIYYSQKLKTFKIIQTPNFQGRVALNTDMDILEISFNLEGIDKGELFNILEAYREKKKYYRLQDGSFIPLEEKEFAELNNITSLLDLNEADFKKDIIQVPKHLIMYFDQLMQEKQLRFLSRNRAFKQLAQNIREPEELDFPVPREISSYLREYQKVGFNWLKTLTHYGFGGILADDMGLGKTLQAISYILAEKNNNVRPVLVVAPTSLVYNWQAEVEQFAPDLKTQIINGPKQEREELLKEIEEADLVITSYPLLRRDIEEYITLDFSCCILDEAQYIKNPHSQTAKAAKMIRAKNYLALTGTPIENTLLELWSIFDFIMPGYLPGYPKFLSKYLIPIEKEKDLLAIEQLAKLVKPFILRRIKADVLKELPPKIENKMVSELTSEQKKIYLAYLDKIRAELTTEIKEKGFEKSRIKVLAGLTRLRQICCHPAMFIENYDGDSGKLEQLKEILKEIIDSGHRVLIFSQFTRMLSIIKEMIEINKYSYFYLDGSVKAKERLERVEAFNQGIGQIFLISLKAGGTGLNLTGADVVIHFDPWWNPAVEDQASDRAHRIGQKKVVQVMKFIAKGTIEEKIYELQEKKKELIDKVIQPGEDILSTIGQKEIYELLDITE